MSEWVYSTRTSHPHTDIVILLHLLIYGRMENQETENWNGHGNRPRTRKRKYPSNYHIVQWCV